MNVTINVESLEKIATYLDEFEMRDILLAICCYTLEDEKHLHFHSAAERMIWDEMQPYLDKSIISYNKWKSEKTKEGKDYGKFIY